MAKETKTVQCYPSDSKINKMIKRYEAFGWELINNQRCQEYEGTYDGYKHWSTFNKLTFSRDKSAPWYAEAEKLENEYIRLMNTEPDEPANSKCSGLRWFFNFLLFLTIVPAIVGIAFGDFLLMGIGFGLFLIPLLMFIMGIRKNNRYKMQYAAYRSELSEWERTTGKQAEDVMAKSAKIVDGAE
ncbi:MAG: hypothetical protein K2L88_00690 [Clostridiales bacterium]|nr:hypothetical protein [Clostridiales bacterium]